MSDDEGSGLAGGALRWAFWYCVVMFLMPFFMAVLLYLSASIVFLYGLRRQLRLAYLHSFWDGARHTVAAFWLATGKFLHGYEVEGLEKLPLAGPALIVYYHGTMPVDMYYLLSEFLLRRKRLIRCVADRFVFRCLPGLEMAFRIMGATEGSFDECVQLLQEGNIISISPGFWQWVYEKCRLPIIPCYGFFPVKMKTFIGDPILFDPLMTPEQLALKVRIAIESMIQKHQRLPGGILMGMVDRLPLHWLGIERKGLERVLAPHAAATSAANESPLNATQCDLSQSSVPGFSPTGEDDQRLQNKEHPQLRALRRVSKSSSSGSGSLPRGGSQPAFDVSQAALATPARRHPHDAFWSRCTCTFAGEEHAPDCAILIPVTRLRAARARECRSRDVGDASSDAARRLRDARGRQHAPVAAGDEGEQWPSLPLRVWLRVLVASMWNALAASDYFYAALLHDHAVSFEGLDLPDDGDADLFD